ncbi:OmpA family protein [Roseovarius sp. EL26]|uniref:OmpA family protein n=1 Tax=Roseovarius sp. EL26 TaxID=2126672 RepID=UPI0013C44C74|nr:OmpA family protein [Roseovarius sp. EL26]
MKVYLSAALNCLLFVPTSAIAQQTVELPVTADACAIHLALTGEVASHCSPPSQSLGAVRRLPPAGFPQHAAPLETEERGYFIRFPFNSSNLTPEYRGHLSRLAKVASAPKMAQACIKLVGHTDSVGGPIFNKTLSSKRARMVAAFLAAEGGIPMERIITEARGEKQPLPKLPGPHPLNRRVEIMARHRDGKTCH